MLRLLPILCGLAYLSKPAEAAWGQVIREDSLPLSEGGEHADADTDYYRLILVHGIFAALAFLLLVPIAIIASRYLKTRAGMHGGRWLRVHQILNALTVLFVTVTFVTGYYAVGPDDNTFDNVHHRIGITIYAAILLNAVIGAANVYLFYRPHVRTPIQNKIHILLGWLVWGLAIANIAVGMVLYGSPKYLFILYAVAGGLWAILFLVLEAVWGRSENHVKRDDYRDINWNGCVVGEKIDHRDSA